jgi:uncharacterized phage-like protein YoqJ
MRVIITGHREEKLETYDKVWINSSIHTELSKLRDRFGISLAYSGMASGVDLMFCDACLVLDIPYVSCIPFEEQSEKMNEKSKLDREHYIKNASSVMNVKNSWMVEHADVGMVVWDGNKGGTHNVLQQLVEKQKPFVWINPVSCVVWECFNK